MYAFLLTFTVPKMAETLKKKIYLHVAALVSNKYYGEYEYATCWVRIIGARWSLTKNGKEEH